MKRFEQLTLPHKDAKGLVWLGDTLVAVAHGFADVPLDGSPLDRKWAGYGRNFDAAQASPNGDVIVLVETAGTKGLLLGADGKVLREINRSYYTRVHTATQQRCSRFQRPHGSGPCPDEYNRIDVEDALTGERLPRVPIMPRHLSFEAAGLD